MYWQFNISTRGEGKPECVLIRAVEPASTNWHQSTTNCTNKICDIRRKFAKIRALANGPGKLCKYFKLDKSFYGEDMTRSKRIWLEDRGEKIPKELIKSGPRIGIDYAGRFWAKKPWRFWIKNNPFISK